MKKKLMMTPIVSAIQETMVPWNTPNTTPFAVGIKIDGKKPTMLMTISIIMLTAIAQIPKDRRYAMVPCILPLVERSQTVR